jgi:small subunit ribosomal protein S16
VVDLAQWFAGIRLAYGALYPDAVPVHEPHLAHQPHDVVGVDRTKKTQERAHVAVKIRLLRMGKIRNPQYRIVVADSRTKRDGRAIEYIGIYHPKEEPSRIEVNSERAQYWLSVGAQPSEPVQRILEKTGDWQKFKNLPAPEPLKVAAPKADRRARYDAESQAAAGLAPAETKPAKKAAKGAKAAAAAPATEPPAAPPAAPPVAAPAETPAQTEEPAGADAGTQA